MPVVTKTGKAGKITLGGNVLVFTKWTWKQEREYADSTDSSTYNATDNQTYKTQAAGSQGAEGTIEGNFDFNSTSTQVWQKMKSDSTVAAIFALDQSTNFASCNVDISGFETGVTVPGAEMIAFTCNFKSNGIITYT